MRVTDAVKEFAADSAPSEEHVTGIIRLCDSPAWTARGGE
jgi:hypothetical protein